MYLKFSAKVTERIVVLLTEIGKLGEGEHFRSVLRFFFFVVINSLT